MQRGKIEELLKLRELAVSPRALDKLTLEQQQLFAALLTTWPTLTCFQQVELPAHTAIELVKSFVKHQVPLTVLSDTRLPATTLIGRNLYQIMILNDWPTVKRELVFSYPQITATHLQTMRDLINQRQLTPEQAFDEVRDIPVTQLPLFKYQQVTADILKGLTPAQHSLLYVMHSRDALDADLLTTILHASWLNNHEFTVRILEAIDKSSIPIQTAIHLVCVLVNKGVSVNRYSFAYLDSQFTAIDFATLNLSQTVATLIFYSRAMGIDDRTFRFEWFNSDFHLCAFRTLLQYYQHDEHPADIAMRILANESTEQAACIDKIYSKGYPSEIQHLMSRLQAYIVAEKVEVPGGATLQFTFENRYWFRKSERARQDIANLNFARALRDRLHHGATVTDLLSDGSIASLRDEHGATRDVLNDVIDYARDGCPNQTLLGDEGVSKSCW